MIKKFNDYNKWMDYINFKEDECIISVIVTFVFMFFIRYLHIYENFSDYVDPLGNLLLYIISGFFGLLGFSLSGIAMVTGLFNKEQVERIEKYNNKKELEKILLSFQFLSFNLGCEILIYFCIYFALFSNVKLISCTAFYIIFCICVYFCSFNIFYTVSLVGNCIQLYKIKNLYEKVSYIEKSVVDMSNEIKIDYILAQVSQLSGKNIEKIIAEIQQTVDESDIQNKQEIIDYIKAYFNVLK